MFGKMVLPLLGGSPAVWNTCLAFYQASLLIGYLYAHVQGKLLTLHRQLLTHFLLLGFSLLFLPIEIPSGWTPPAVDNPVPWLLLLLFTALGFPFVMLSASAPLLQNWYSRSGRPGASDPYFLYAASNLGSLVGLLGYPFLLEPYLSLSEQSEVWSGSYIAFFLFIGCAALLLRRSAIEGVHCEETLLDSEPPGWWRRVHWVLLAAVPSSLLQGVTTYITTDLAAVPLLWVIPLAIYLISFVLVFSRRKLIPHTLIVRIQPFVLLAVVIVVFWSEWNNFWYLIPLNLSVLFVTAMCCHGEMVRLRPGTAHLTEFYLWMAAGGVIGGMFNAFAAPLIFSNLAEFPIAIACAAFLLPAVNPDDAKYLESKWDIIVPAGLGAAVVGAKRLLDRWPETAYDPTYYLATACAGGLLILLLCRRPLRFGIGIGTLLALAWFWGIGVGGWQGDTLYSHRSFFGILKVHFDQDTKEVTLVHNVTIHGSQNRQPQYAREPMSYYSRIGPLGDIFKSLPSSPNGRKTAVIGLGAGAAAAYAGSNDHWVFYEINPAVQRVAQNPNYFTYLADAPGIIEIAVGDARLSLAAAPDGYFDFIVLDAFSGDSVPVHLLTKEAIELYLKKLSKDGHLAFHVSNRFLKLDSVVRSLADDAGLKGYIRKHDEVSDEETSRGVMGSHWVVVARSRKALARLSEMPDWQDLDQVEKNKRTWTDDYSNIVQCLIIDLK
jgi:hypothetical protein